MSGYRHSGLTEDEYNRREKFRDLAALVTVGPVPTRKGMWLGVQRNGVWTALAKFRSDEAAAEFLALMGKEDE